MIATLTPEAEITSGSANIDQEALYQIIDGQRVGLPPTSILATRVTTKLIISLGQPLLSNPVGEGAVETLFHLPLPVDRNRRPDVAFISAKALAESLPQADSDTA